MLSKAAERATLQKRKRISRWHVADVKAHVDLQVFYFSAQIFLRFTNSLLKPSEQLILFSLAKREIIIAQLCVFLFQSPFHLVPTAFEFQFRHSNRDSRAGGGSAVSRKI